MGSLGSLSGSVHLFGYVVEVSLRDVAHTVFSVRQELGQGVAPWRLYVVLLAGLTINQVHGRVIGNVDDGLIGQLISGLNGLTHRILYHYGATRNGQNCQFARH